MADLFIDTSARLRVSYDSCRLQRYPVAELGLRPRSTVSRFDSAWRGREVEGCGGGQTQHARGGFLPSLSSELLPLPHNHGESRSILIALDNYHVLGGLLYHLCRLKVRPFHQK